MAVLLGSVTTFPDIKQIDTYWAVAEEAVLLPDGRVMALGSGQPMMYTIFTPDINGAYETGTWSTPKVIGNFSKLGAAATVLKDGRVIFMGGHDQYRNDMQNWVWDWKTDTWSVNNDLSGVTRGFLGNHDTGGGGPGYFPDGRLTRFSTNIRNGTNWEAGWAHTPNYKYVQVTYADVSTGLTRVDVSQNSIGPIEFKNLSGISISNSYISKQNYGGYHPGIREEGMCSMYMPTLNKVAHIGGRGEILVIDHNSPNWTQSGSVTEPMTKRWSRPSKSIPIIQLDSYHAGQSINQIAAGGILKFRFTTTEPKNLNLNGRDEKIKYGWQLHFEMPDGSCKAFTPTGIINDTLRYTVNGVQQTMNGPTVIYTTGLVELNFSGYASARGHHDPATLSTPIHSDRYMYQGGPTEVYAEESLQMIAPNGYLMWMAQTFPTGGTSGGPCLGYWDGVNDPTWATTYGSFRPGGGYDMEVGRGAFLWLPTGQLMSVYGGDLWKPPTSWLTVGTAPGNIPPSHQPSVALFPSSVISGGTFSVSGTCLFGRHLGAHMGDDHSFFSNHPIARVKNKSTNAIYSCRVRDWSEWSIAENATTSHKVDLPLVPAGEYELTLYSNGVSSAKVDVTVVPPAGGGITVNQYGR